MSLQGCEAKLEGFLQSVLSYAMLVILGFAIIKVASSASLKSVKCFCSVQVNLWLTLNMVALCLHFFSSSGWLVSV